MATSHVLKPEPCPTLSCLSPDFPASLFQSLANARVLKIRAGQCFLNLREYCAQNSLDYSSLRMLKDFSATTMARLLRPSSLRLRNWGMTCNGKCLTANISAFPKTGSEPSLSDILEAQVEEKYFLSFKTVTRLL